MRNRFKVKAFRLRIYRIGFTVQGSGFKV